ncbi:MULTISPECIES: hypothetical protein [Campylobacter]|uniref:hypothetical protein n=1 Tax=Campylobacter TaxID=194 RepID=UPI000A34752D|nr:MULTISPECIES: hypothetical protein [unclassified Campylobacter]MCR8679672.1 hypothetical protein [Campylobacter sp. RM19072]MEE3777402.1 hypothetical protein [Campylobacter sp. CX2-4080-23]
MLRLIFSTIRNIGLGIFVNGTFALKFGDGGSLAYLAIVEGIEVMLLAGYAELKAKGANDE